MRIFANSHLYLLRRKDFYGLVVDKNKLKTVIKCTCLMALQLYVVKLRYKSSDLWDHY